MTDEELVLKKLAFIETCLRELRTQTLSSKYFGFDATGIRVLDPALRVSN